MDNDIKQKLTEAKEWLQKEYTRIRTGQASPALLDNLKIDSFGSMLPINQVGSVGVEDARTLRIAPWDVSQIPVIDKAIQDANLGVSLATDSSGLRVIFPELTSERRDQLLKLAKAKLEDSRITVRAVRDDMMKAIDKSEKEGDISEDEKFTKKEDVQADIDKANSELESLFEQKENELKA